MDRIDRKVVFCILHLEDQADKAVDSEVHIADSVGFECVVPAADMLMEE